MMRVYEAFWETAHGSVSRVPHSCGAMVIRVGCVGGRLCVVLKAMAPVRAGDDGWSVIVTAEALARALMREGRAVPRYHPCK